LCYMPMENYFVNFPRLMFGMCMMSDTIGRQLCLYVVKE